MATLQVQKYFTSAARKLVHVAQINFGKTIVSHIHLSDQRSCHQAVFPTAWE